MPEDNKEVEKVLLSQTIGKYKLTDQQEEAVKLFLFDPVCQGNTTLAYGKAGYDKKRSDVLKVTNANAFFKKPRIVNRIQELTGDDKSIINVDVFKIDKMSSTKDIKDALAKLKAKIEGGNETPSIINGYIKLLDMQAKAAGLYKVEDETTVSDQDKSTEKATKMYLSHIKGDAQKVS
jgi:hypothetical protein